MKTKYPYFLANEALAPNQDLPVTNKYTGEEAFRVALADREAIDQAIVAADSASSIMRGMPAYQRQEVLNHCVSAFTERFEDFAHALSIEAGKPINDSRGEVTRLIDTFRVAAEESVRMNGEVQELEISARARGYRGQWKRVPIGPCSFISPFNFPLNLAAHKIAPAIAVGCPFILKPASLTPIGALMIGEVLSECNLPKGAFSILPCSREGAELFTTDERLKLLSFTGSPEVGWALKAKAEKKKVVLELGGNAACIVDEGADIDDAVQRIVFGAFYQSGQSCISVQRIYVHASLYEEFKIKLVQATEKLVSGDPLKDDTFIGPMISEREAIRIERWIQEAVASGAKLLCGGKRKGATLEASLLEDVSTDQKVVTEEAFGPLAVLARFDHFDEAVESVNNSKFGLQAGVFTSDLYKALDAWDHLDVGGVVIGDVPSFRVDNIPYGGVKDSGLGREGIRFAMEDMTEIRNLIIRDPR